MSDQPAPVPRTRLPLDRCAVCGTSVDPAEVSIRFQLTRPLCDHCRTAGRDFVMPKLPVPKSEPER
jgi:hypothetical protein